MKIIVVYGKNISVHTNEICGENSGILYVTGGCQ
jgi:hypothetical protein